MVSGLPKVPREAEINPETEPRPQFSFPVVLTKHTLARNSELETQKVLRSSSPENLTSPHLSWVFRTPGGPYLPHVPPISEPRSPHLSGCLPALAIRKLLLISISTLIMELQEDGPEERMGQRRVWKD